MKRRTALFGGTFDPVHKGHIIVAESAARQINADELYFIPVRRSPQKMFMPQAGAAERVRMIELAISGMDKFSVSRFEIERAEPSYTLQTVRHFKEMLGVDTEIYWLVGADTLDELAHWYEIEKLIDECNLSVLHRAGFERLDFGRLVDVFGKERAEKLRRNVIETPLVDISSSEIRKRGGFLLTFVGRVYTGRNRVGESIWRWGVIGYWLALERAFSLTWGAKCI